MKGTRGPGRWPLLAEASALLVVAAILIRMLPFRTVWKLAGGESACLPDGAQVGPDVLRPAWAVEAAARRLPLRLVCFQKGLALSMMLRRRGIGSTLHYGVTQNEERLSAHVWLSVGGQIVLGAAAAPQHVCLAQASRRSVTE
ncbi:MAG: lasso peptide biosynthesis B2 protein [Allosphingosinicella sp.]|uniref:lasso peptide biosynthesis B2 protein n=1 Tax=Allosphingosinicella sp. TaxID=2823234 RepID=UPI003939ADF1